MADAIIVRALANADAQFQWLDPADQQTILQGHVMELAAAAGNKPIRLLLPATEILLLTLTLPIRSSRQLKQAIPYALEEHLADDLENYHWSWQKLSDDRVAVSIIDQEKLKQRLESISNVNLNLIGVYSEALVLPMVADRTSIWIEDGYAVVRFNTWLGGGIELDCLPALLESYPEKQSVQQWSSATGHDQYAKLQPNQSDQIVPNLLSIADQETVIPLNLLTGVYSIGHAKHYRWRPWLPSMMIVLIAISIQYGQVIAEYQHLQHQLNELELGNQQLFRQTFPEIKRIVNIKAQAEQALADRRKKQQNRHPFLRLLFLSGQQLQQQTELKLQALNYSNQTLSLQLTSNSIAELDQFKQQLEQQSNLKVVLQSVETGNHRVSAQLELSESSL